MRVPGHGKLAGVMLLAIALTGCGPGIVAAAAVALSTIETDDSDPGPKGGPDDPCQPPLGILDPSLAGPGWAVWGNPGGGDGDDYGSGIVLDSMGRILVCGQTVSASGSTDMMIWRLNDNGTLDQTFNGQGWVSFDGGNGQDYASAGIALDSQGRILVGGMIYGGSLTVMDFATWCYLEDGTLDTSFNGQGWLTRHNIAGGDGIDMPWAMTVDGNDRILLTGSSAAGGLRGVDMVVVRYDPDGTPDMTFGSGGFMIHHGAAGGDGNDEGIAIALDGAGRIFVAGCSRGPGNDLDMVVWCLGPYGMLDTTFGIDGFVVHADAAGGRRTDLAAAVVVDETGRILVGGWSEDPTWDEDAVIWRFNPDGTLDTTFMGKGFVIHDSAAGGIGMDRIRGLTLDCAGGILATGRSMGPALDYEMVIWRYEATGTLDSGFGLGGVVVHADAAGGGGDDTGNAIAIDGAGRILVAGRSENSRGNDDMVLWRYE